MSDKPLSPQRKRFVEAFLANGGNATQAAITAGYAKKAARQTGHKLVTSGDIQAEIQRRRVPVVQRLEVATEWTLAKVIDRLALIADFDLRKIYDEQGNPRKPHELPSEIVLALASHKTRQILTDDGTNVLTINLEEYRSNDRQAALMSIGKHLGGFREKDPDDPAAAALPVVDAALLETLSNEELKALRVAVELLRAAKQRVLLGKGKKKRGGRV